MITDSGLVVPNANHGRDLFDRADAANLGSDWRADTTAARIVSNAAQSRTVSSNTGRQAGGWSTYQGGNNGGRLYSDAYRLRALLKNPSTALAGNNSFTVFYLAGPDTFGAASGFVAVGVSNTGGCSINTQTGTPNGPGGSLGGTQRAAHAQNWAAGDLLEFVRTRTQVIVLRNGAALPSGGLSWTPGAGECPSGIANRRWGFCPEANFPIFQEQYSSLAVEWIEAEDI